MQVRAALSVFLAGCQVAGHYIASGRPVQPARQALDRDAAALLWDASCQLTGVTTHATLL